MIKKIIMFLSKHICLLKLLVYKLNFKQTFLEWINLNNISIFPMLLYIYVAPSRKRTKKLIVNYGRVGLIMWG